jgi:hypothetical protein
MQFQELLVKAGLGRVSMVSCVPCGRYLEIYPELSKLCISRPATLLDGPEVTTLIIVA